MKIKQKRTHTYIECYPKSYDNFITIIDIRFEGPCDQWK